MSTQPRTRRCGNPDCPTGTPALPTSAYCATCAMPQTVAEWQQRMESDPVATKRVIAAIWGLPLPEEATTMTCQVYGCTQDRARRNDYCARCERQPICEGGRILAAAYNQAEHAHREAEHRAAQEWREEAALFTRLIEQQAAIRKSYAAEFYLGAIVVLCSAWLGKAGAEPWYAWYTAAACGAWLCSRGAFGGRRG